MRPLALVLLAACASDPHAPDPDRVARTITSRTGDVGAVVDGNDAFTWDLYGALVAADDGNLLFSPFSIAAALGMTSAGAAGDTLGQLRDGLHVTLDAGAWHPAFGALVDDLNGDKSRGYRLEVANRLFGQAEVPWSEAFLATCTDDWRAPFEPVDFAGDPEAGRERVNDWVSEQTAGRIPDLLPPGVITTDTRLVLANAIYFLATWWTRFDEAETYEGTFTRLDGSTVRTPLMRIDLAEVADHRVRSAELDDGSGVVVRLPYEDDEVAAYLVIPAEPDGLPDLEASLDAEAFAAWVAPVEGAGREDADEEGLVVVPKLELRWKASLVPHLQALGVTDAFDGTLADFSPMADDGAADGFAIADVVHEAWMKVDEAGTEAAAATAVVITDTAAPLPRVADHPFLFVIRDDLTGSLLFVARVVDPTAG